MGQISDRSCESADVVYLGCSRIKAAYPVERYSSEPTSRKQVAEKPNCELSEENVLVALAI